MYAIETKNLTKKYNDLTAVDNLNINIKKGELFSLLGINGAGKTTLIKMLTGITKPTSGDAFLNDFSIKNDSLKVKTFIAVSPQETAIAFGLTVRENLELVCDIYSLGEEKKKSKLKEIIAIFGFEGVLNKKAGKLSGGWQRRLSVAMALITEPEILFLDEPTLGLDVISRSELWNVLRSLKNNITIILTTHYLEEAEALSDRIAIMKDGKILVCDTVEEIKIKANADTFQKAFVKIVKEAAEQL